MVPELRALVAYLSFSGNTEEVAGLISGQLEAHGFAVEQHRIGIHPPIDPEFYDLIFLGTFTWDQGATPDEVKDFVLEIGYKPRHIAVFGTGETQFGGDAWFCRAAVRLARFYESRWEPLKIEQSPRGAQEEQVKDWTERIVQDVKRGIEEGEGVGAGLSQSGDRTV